MRLEIILVWNQNIFVSDQVCGASLRKSLAGLDSTQTDGVQALSTLEDITHQLKQAGEIHSLLLLDVHELFTILNKLWIQQKYTLGKNMFMTEKQSLVFLVTLKNLVSMALFVILRIF